MAPTNTSETRAALAATAASVVTTAITGGVCALPLAAIVLGVGGLGWLTQYAYLRGPASLLTLTLLGYGFWHCYGPSSRCGRQASSKGRVRVTRAFLWVAAGLALTVNLFEYVVLPRLG